MKAMVSPLSAVKSTARLRTFRPAQTILRGHSELKRLAFSFSSIANTILSAIAGGVIVELTKRGLSGRDKRRDDAAAVTATILKEAADIRAEQRREIEALDQRISELREQNYKLQLAAIQGEKEHCDALIDMNTKITKQRAELEETIAQLRARTEAQQRQLDLYHASDGRDVIH